MTENLKKKERKKENGLKARKRKHWFGYASEGEEKMMQGKREKENETNIATENKNARNKQRES